MSHLCDICEKDATLMCQNCKHSIYCSSRCQQKDYPKHASICYTVEEVDDDTMSPMDKKKDRAVKRQTKKEEQDWYREEKSLLMEKQKQEMKDLRLRQKEERNRLEARKKNRSNLF